MDKWFNAILVDRTQSCCTQYDRLLVWYCHTKTTRQPLV